MFSDTRPVWTAAWIDSRETLKSSYKTILKVADVARRDALIAELANLPITMADVAAARDKRKEIESAGRSAEEWKARNRIQMVKDFRAHYERVAAKAR